MKKLPLVMLSVFLWGGTASAAITVVQHISHDVNAVGTTFTDTFSSTTGSGNLLVCALGNNNGRMINSVTDDKGNNFTQFPGAAAVPSGTWSSDVWYLPKSTNGSQVMTVTFSGLGGASFNKVIVCWEVSGFTPNVTTDGSNFVAFGTQTGTTVTGAPVTTTSTGFIIGYVQSDNFVSANPLGGNEFTSGGDITTHGNAGCSLISSSAGTHQPVWSAGGTNFTTSTAAFKNASAGPTAAYLSGGTHLGGGKFR